MSGQTNSVVINTQEMKSNSKEEVSRFTYQSDLERKRERKPKQKLSWKLSMICVERLRPLHAYL